MAEKILVLVSNSQETILLNINQEIKAIQDEFQENKAID